LNENGGVIGTASFLVQSRSRIRSMLNQCTQSIPPALCPMSPERDMAQNVTYVLSPKKGGDSAEMGHGGCKRSLCSRGG
jgi:hypothetical protein